MLEATFLIASISSKALVQFLQLLCKLRVGKPVLKFVLPINDDPEIIAGHLNLGLGQ
jgi:hypothetical protein